MGLFAFCVFVVLPIAEIMLAVFVADQIGWDWTLLALLGLSMLGVLVIRGTWRAAAEVANTDPTVAMASAPAVGTKAADAAIRMFAGFCLLIPGFITAAVGLLLLLPPVRALVRVAAGNAVLRRFPTMQSTVTRVRIMTTDPGNVVPGQVVDPDASTQDPDADPPRSIT
ncbi:MAG TPA: FxsA family protein [Actinomycetes bacterium]|nr:FxsA family protein [Actinomycetes bacterium]